MDEGPGAARVFVARTAIRRGNVDGDTLAALEALAQTQRQIVTLTYNPFFVAESDPRRWLATLSAEVKGTGATPDEALAALLARLDGHGER